MKRILLDTNVLLDLGLDRQPHSFHAKLIFRAMASGLVRGYVTSMALATIHYIAEKAVGWESARAYIEDLLEICDLAEPGLEDVRLAADRRHHDFEDALQNYAALRADCEIIVTRDPKGFKGSSLTILAPADLISELNSGIY